MNLMPLSSFLLPTLITYRKVLLRRGVREGYNETVFVQKIVKNSPAVTFVRPEGNMLTIQVRDLKNLKNVSN